MEWSKQIIRCDSFEDAIIFLLDDNKMFPLIKDGLIFLIKEQKDRIDLIDVIWNRKEKYEVSLIRSNIIDTLDKLLNWLEKNEYYEDCQIIYSLKRELN